MEILTAEELNTFIQKEYKCDKILVFISTVYFNSLKNKEVLNLLTDADDKDILESDIIYALYPLKIKKGIVKMSKKTVASCARISAMWKSMEPKGKKFIDIIFEDEIAKLTVKEDV